MTRCCRDSMNLKSTAYNQTGQNCVEQLSMYRCMCTHLRRVLLAKSVVDTRNPRFARSIQRRCRPASCKLRFLERDFCCPSDETIDKLAYDTEHHPSEIIRVTCRSKSSPKERSCSRERASNDANCSCLRASATTVKGPSVGVKSNLKNQQRVSADDCPDCRRTKECDYDKQRICDSKSDCSPECRSGRSRKWSLQEDGPAAAAAAAGDDEQTFRKLAEREEEEALYAKFVYDITQEIVQNGLYTDRELKEVFARHLNRNSACLNKRKMLYEIYQLKISLNMDDSEDEDETETDLVYAEKFFNQRVPKPPTPLKVLNENKVIEKLESFKQQQQHDNGEHSALSSPTGRKSVTLVDANPEFLVTERDFLNTLADNQVDPEQIQRIFRTLFQKSKDMSLYEAVQVGTEVAYSHRLKSVDRCTSATSLNSTYVRERPHGILRKESTDFLGKSLSPETSRRRYNYVLDKRNEALEKCSKWKTTMCDCRTQPCKEHLDLVGKEKTLSPEKIRAKEVHVVKDKPQKKPGVDKKVKVVKQPTKVKKAEKIKTEKPIKVVVVKKKEVKSSPEMSERTSSPRELTTEEKQESSSSRRHSYTRQARLEEPEEIEEDIESVIEESPTKSSRRSSITADKPDDEEKELASSPEKDNDDELSSIATENEDDKDNESAKYSDDFSDVSDENDSSDSPAKTSKSTTPRGKVLNRARYPSMKDYFDRFTTIDEQKIWRISEGSSSSSSSSASSMNPMRASEDAANADGPPPVQQQRNAALKRRMSSGAYLSGDAWRQRPSAVSADFYANALAKYCDPACRKPGSKSCSDHCKFVKTNCRNLSRPTDCLTGLKPTTALSGESTSTIS